MAAPDGDTGANADGDSTRLSWEFPACPSLTHTLGGHMTGQFGGLHPHRAICPPLHRLHMRDFIRFEYAVCLYSLSL